MRPLPFYWYSLFLSFLSRWRQFWIKHRSISNPFHHISRQSALLQGVNYALYTHKGAHFLLECPLPSNANYLLSSISALEQKAYESNAKSLDTRIFPETTFCAYGQQIFFQTRTELLCTLTNLPLLVRTQDVAALRIDKRSPSVMGILDAAESESENKIENEGRLNCPLDLSRFSRKTSKLLMTW